MNPKSVYNYINKISRGIFESHSQSKELRNTQQMYRQKSNAPSAITQDSKDELLACIMFETKRYHTLLSYDSQLQHVEQFCCQKIGVTL